MEITNQIRFFSKNFLEKIPKKKEDIPQLILKNNKKQ